MSDTEDRKNAFEGKFAHDEEQRFRLEARAAKRFGTWAAEQMGLSGAEIEPYAQAMVAANLEEAGFADVKRKARADFDEKGVTVSDHMIDAMLERFTQETGA